MISTQLLSSRAFGSCLLQRTHRQSSPRLQACWSRRAWGAAGARRPLAVKAQAAAGAADAEPASPPPPAGRHAFLHDFCLCIPYGGLIALCGLVMKLFGGGQTALLIAGAGVAEMALSTLSLKAWRARQPVAGLFTVLEAAVAGALTYKAWIGWQAGIARMPHAVLGLLSAGMTLFLVYNVLAGGNPPPKGTH